MNTLTKEQTEQIVPFVAELNGKNGIAEHLAHDPEAALIEPRSQDGLRVSEEEYWATYYHDPDFDYEWNNGILEEKPMANVRGSMQYQWFCSVLDAYLKVNPVARMVNLEIGFRLALPEKTTVRKPDLFVVRHDNPTPLDIDDATFHGICDLCIESLSDSARSEIERDTVRKKEEYAGIGVGEYYILDGRGRYTTFYQASTTPEYTSEYTVIAVDDEGVLHSQVLPGFQFRVRDLYLQPSLIELADDPVYQDFVLPEYQNEKQRATEADRRAEQERLRAEQERLRAEQERLRAEQERLRAEQERQRAIAAEERAERLAAQLRTLGLLNE